MAKSPANIPSQFADLANSFPESSYGAHKVILKLSNGTHIRDAILAWGKEVVRIGETPISSLDQLDFDLEDIVAIEDAS